MSFHYVGSGGKTLSGCAKATGYKFYLYKYGEGSIVYARYKALRGCIEKVAIKKVLINFTKYGQPVVIYKDSFNSLWNEPDLVYESEAVALADAFLANREAIFRSLPCHDAG